MQVFRGSRRPNKSRALAPRFARFVLAASHLPLHRPKPLTASCTMSVVTLTNITVLDNPTKFTNPFQFDISFECISPLQEDLEFKVIYVGSAETERFDQVLDSIAVGPVPIGLNKFVFQTEPPKVALLPSNEVLGVTVVLLICSYRDQEFIRVGYYVNNEYETEELRLQPPSPIDFDKIQRNILADKPRVTRIPIKWDDTVDPDIVAPILTAEDELLDEGSEAEETEERFEVSSSDEGSLLFSGMTSEMDEAGNGLENLQNSTNDHFNAFCTAMQN